MNDERSRTIKRFFDVYPTLQEKYNLRLHIHFSEKECLIEIWEHRPGQKRRYICKIEVEDEAWCYERAAKELECYEKQKKEELYVSTDRNLPLLWAVGDGRT